MQTVEKQTFTRKQLYDLVWSQSLLSLSKKYSISDVGLRKICFRMDIPLPRAGHWEKLKHGKKVIIAKLPTSYRGENEVTLSLRNENEVHHPSKKVSLVKVVDELKQTSELNLVVPERLNSPEKLIVVAKQSLNSKEAHYGLYKGVLSTKRGELSIRVSPQNVSRALRIMDTLIKALHKRGHAIIIEKDQTHVEIKDQKIPISIKEKLKRVPIENPKWAWESSEWVSTGVLTFRIEGQKEWKDGKELLEQQLPKIVAHLELEAQNRQKRKEELEKYWEEQREKQRLARELEERKEKDLAHFKDILQKATRWHKATNLRNYIDAFEQKALANGIIPDEQQNWISWARLKADWYDPFVECEDKLLKDVDKESLTFKNKTTYPTW